MKVPDKTNAIRLIEQAGISCHLHVYDPNSGIDGVSVAASLGELPDQVFKTLVTEGRDNRHFVFVIPVTATLDLKKAAKTAGEKSIVMIPQKSLLPLTGYIHGGCSPVGMKKMFPTFIDETAQLFDRIFVSGGRIGLQMELSPLDLAGLVNASFVSLT